MICQFQFCYSQDWEKVTEERWERVRQINPSIRPLAYEGEGEKRKPAMYENTCHTYIGDVRPLLALGFKLELKGMDSPDATTLFGVRLLDKLESMEQRLLAAPHTEAQHFNAKCNVTVPGFALLSITEVMLCENECTDSLQDHLKEGWRIIAVCPQPDQRRPDYVLGKVTT